jgi:predicted negative regulator of RcsB-dependent stress response
MSNLDLEEQEKVAELKAWWNRWGNLILTGITAVMLVFAAYNGWQWYKRSQNAEAASRYQQVQDGAEAKDTKKVRDATGEILEKYPRSAYAPLAALVSAKVHFDAGDLKTARSQLQWVVDNARDPELQATARLRLANVLVDDKALDEALKVLDAKFSDAYAPLVANLRGDILLLQGKKAEARTAFRLAIEKSDAGRDRMLRDRVQLKLDALGEG